MPAASVVVLKLLVGVGMAAAGLACLLLPVIAIWVLLRLPLQEVTGKKP